MNRPTDGTWQSKLDDCKTLDEVEELVSHKTFCHQLGAQIYTTEERQAATRRVGEIAKKLRK